MDQYTVAFVFGYLTWGFISDVVVSKIVLSVWEKTTESYKKTGKPVPFWLDNEKREPFNWAPRLIGVLERIFYTSAVVFGQFTLIILWIAFKVIGEWSDISSSKYRNKSEEEGGTTRIRANNFLIGNAFSLLFGIAGGIIFRLTLNQNFLAELIQKSYTPTN